MEKLPGKTVERLSQYRRSLMNYLESGRDYIFSHELAELHHFTAVQVRRDLMLLGYSSVYRKGYPVEKLIEVITAALETKSGQNVAVIGMGKLGMALSQYLGVSRPGLRVVAGFDRDKNKVGKQISGISCYDMSELKQIIDSKDISIGILTVPHDYAVEVCTHLCASGIKGILNFTHMPLVVPEDVYLEEYDMITSLEKVAYFVKES